MSDSIIPAACVIGHPIKHSRSPLIHNYWLKHFHINGLYEVVDISPANVERWLMNIAPHHYVGGNITLPHKERAFSVIKNLDSTARAVGAVNTFWFENGDIWGGNTDVEGFLQNLHSQYPQWKNNTAHAVVLGAGGAAKAVVYGLAISGVKLITVVNRTISKAQELTEVMNEMARAEIKGVGFSQMNTILPNADMLVNTTSLGMDGSSPLELDVSLLPITACVSDIVYTPLKTKLLGDAENRGLRTIDGLGMLLHQAVSGFEKWFNFRPQVTSQLRELIIADLNREA